MVITNVFDGSESEGKALRELDATDNRKRKETVEERHEASGAEEEEDDGSGETGGGDLGDGEVAGRRLCDGYSGDGLHGLDGHRDVEEEAGGDVVEGGEDEGGAEVEVRDEGEG